MPSFRGFTFSNENPEDYPEGYNGNSYFYQENGVLIQIAEDSDGEVKPIEPTLVSVYPNTKPKLVECEYGPMGALFYKVPDAVKRIGRCAMQDVSFENLWIGDSVTYVDNTASYLRRIIRTSVITKPMATSAAVTT